MKHRRTGNTILVMALIAAHLLGFSVVDAQQAGQEIRWMRVGDLHSWFSNLGAESELGRTGLVAQQQDGLMYPAQYAYQDNLVNKALWIGTTNYVDPNYNNKLFDYKVIGAGPRPKDLSQEMMPVDFYMVGRAGAPSVIVDGETATDNALNDAVDYIDPDLPADRMIVNIVNTSVGVTVDRRIYAFSHPYHDNYFIYDYVFKNTGIIDNEGTVKEVTLTEVYFYFQYRYAIGHEVFARGFESGWAPANNVNWGRNTVNHVIGTDPTAADFEMRAQYSWYGRHSGTPPDYQRMLGAPNHVGDGHLGAPQFVGVVTLHADMSAEDKSDDPYQPATTHYLGADTGPHGGNPEDQFNSIVMTNRWNNALTLGHADQTHAERVGNGFADQYGDDAGGYLQGQGFGPYTLEPGDSIRIVLAEGVGSINRDLCFEVGRNMKQENAPYIMADGSETDNRMQYVNSWVQTGEDSLMQTFRRAIDNFESDFTGSMAPPAPNVFEVTSGGDKISLTWAANAESWPNFEGYRLYRAIGKPDTSYSLLFECSVSNGNLTTAYDDTSADRGFDYYYYVQAFDDGTTNAIEPGIPLTSGKFYTMTNKAANLLKPASDEIEAIRIVPNPYDIRGRQLQYGTDNPDRIAFLGLPGVCTIRIFTERGDLIKTIEHTNGTGDEYWDSLTESRQVIVSGLYIAHFSTPDGRSIIRKFVVIR